MISKLIQGHRTFFEKEFPSEKGFFQQLSGGQKPHTLWITCSDSRVDPNQIVGQKPGKLFIYRNIGNIVTPHSQEDLSISSVLEYAISRLKVQSIVICGHSHCGAMESILNPDGADDLPQVQGWLRDTARELADSIESDCSVDQLVQENVLLQRHNLSTYPIVRESMDRQEVDLLAWVYQIADGKIIDCETSESILLGSEKKA